MVRQEFLNKIKNICEKEGVNISFIYSNGAGGFDSSKNLILIPVRDGLSESQIATLFCHELAHFKNWKNGKYPTYHSTTWREEAKKFRTAMDAAEYALDAEVYTEHIGRKLCKRLFPEVKYKAFYRKTQKHLWFLFGYYSNNFVGLAVPPKGEK